ncbi:hypothetical protein [Antarcticirhabdus aurantiaca]|uniref:Uncharacterized protein n=1 Tax=Antarcticirhabdus aurantiaca TaxID=2606717 RepID=A0ACD4NNM9_9HYPH|nr:hypothetical protein [Antarcticirhabdus aurantiaca]WAJ28479.1 hypothetical protein OXU80_27345 [Jeongeuplla avenae]
MLDQTLDTTDHTVSGLLRKRADLFNEATRLRDRIAEIKNDIEALDRTMRTFGYIGDLDAAMPRQKRQVMFGAGELSRSILRELRDADGPMTTREIAQSIVALRGDDARDRRLVTEISNRVSKALRSHREAGRVRSSVDDAGNLLWSRRVGKSGDAKAVGNGTPIRSSHDHPATDP